MPRFTLLRVFFFVCTFYLSVVAIFAFIPNPQYNPGLERDAHIQQIFHTGQELTTVHEYDDTFESANDLGYPYGRRGWSSHVAITWRLEPCRKTNSIFLRIGGKGLNLTDAVVQHATSLPYLGPANAYRTKAADVMRDTRWFDPADEMLLNHQNTPLYENVSLRYLVPKPGQVQVWKDHENWETDFHQMSDLDDDDRSIGLLATFSGIPDGSSEETAGKMRSKICQIAVSDVSGLITSKTYHIRKFLLTITIPVIYFVGFVASTAMYPVIAIFSLLYDIAQLLAGYFMLVAFVWLCNGRPSFRKWSKKSWLTKWVHRIVVARSTRTKVKVWSATGPMEDQEDLDDDDDDDDVEVIEVMERVPLRNPAQFFRSRSPLDDLLFTFESTRWMVEPLKFRNPAGSRSVRSQETDEEAATVVASPAAPVDEKDDKTKVRIMI